MYQTISYYLHKLQVAELFGYNYGKEKGKESSQESSKEKDCQKEENITHNSSLLYMIHSL